MGTLLLMEEIEIDQTEIARVAGNWIDQPGTECFDPFLKAQGIALRIAGDKRAAKIKQTFPLEWSAWNVDLDQGDVK
jgi:hypothetical protein